MLALRLVFCAVPKEISPSSWTLWNTASCEPGASCSRWGCGLNPSFCATVPMVARAFSYSASGRLPDTTS
jgi:hypothetical protein